MSACHQGCGAHCRACEIAAVVMSAGPLTEKDLGDMVILGHVMAMISTVQRTGPIGRLHLCERHAAFALATAQQQNVTLVIGHATNAPMSKELN